jgi:exosortase
MSQLTSSFKPLSADRPVPGWATRGLGVAALLAIVGFVGSEAWTTLFLRATQDSESSHLTLVPVIAVWLVFVRRQRFRDFPVQLPWAGCFIAAVGMLGFVFGTQYSAFLAFYLGAVTMLVGAIVTVTGVAALRRFFPAFLILGFLTPLPPSAVDAMARPLMDIASVATEFVLTLLAIPIERTGNLISINGVEVTVEEACAGMRGIWALTLVAVAFAFASPYRWWARLLILGLSPLLALVCNVIRLVPTVWVYGNFSDEAAKTFHDLAGWAVLFIGYLLLTGVATLLELLGVPILRQRPESTTEVLS